MNSVLELQPGFQQPPTLIIEQVGIAALGLEIGTLQELNDQMSIEARAWELIKNRETVQKVEVKEREYFDNGRTTLMEAMTASGHLSRVEIEGTVDEINAQVLNRLLNAWDESLPFHEKQRRFAELCNELKIQDTHQKVAKGELSSDTQVIEVSDYPVALAEEGVKLGYRWSNLKGMVRATGFEYLGEGQWKRVIEQGSRSKGVFDTSSSFYMARGIQLSQDKPEDIVVLGSPIITNEFRDGVIDVMRELDYYAGPGIHYGEEAHEKQVAYEDLREESARREGEIENYSRKLAVLEEQLDGMVVKGEIPESEKLEIYLGEVKRHLSAICSTRTEYAEATFGKKAAECIYKASDLIASGNIELARKMLIQAELFSETITFCGVSISVKSAIDNGLKLNTFGGLVDEDKYGSREFSCPHCTSTNRRPEGQLIKNCQSCNKDVTC